MKLLLVLIFLLATTTTMGARVPFVIDEVGDKFEALDTSIATNLASVTAINARTEGARKQELLIVDYDFAVDGGTVGTIASGVSLPDNAVVQYCWYEVLTTFGTASADSGTIAINIPTDGDLQAATAVSAGGNVYDAGLHECATAATDSDDPSTWIKTTAARDISFVIAGQNVTAGKLKLHLKFTVTE